METHVPQQLLHRHLPEIASPLSLVNAMSDKSTDCFRRNQFDSLAARQASGHFYQQITRIILFAPSKCARNLTAPIQQSQPALLSLGRYLLAADAMEVKFSYFFLIIRRRMDKGGHSLGPPEPQKNGLGLAVPTLRQFNKAGSAWLCDRLSPSCRSQSIPARVSGLSRAQLQHARRSPQSQ